MTNKIQNNLSYTSSSHMQSTLACLKQDGLHGFVHDITFGNGEISILSDSEAVYEFYYKNRYPAIYTNSNGRTLSPGIYLDSKLKKHDDDYLQSISFISDKFRFKHIIHIVENDDDCQNLYSFTYNLNEIEFTHQILNNIENLKKFIQFHKRFNNELINLIKQPKNRIVLPYSDETKKSLTLLNTKQNANKLNLTNRELDCLRLTIRGMSARRVAAELFISRRTVEEYLNNIKLKFNVRSKQELIAKAIDNLKSP
jgi:DNA-binding CsgD family transcriptional regulator